MRQKLQPRGRMLSTLAKRTEATHADLGLNVVAIAWEYDAAGSRRTASPANKHIKPNTGVRKGIAIQYQTIPTPNTHSKAD